MGPVAGCPAPAEPPAPGPEAPGGLVRRARLAAGLSQRGLAAAAGISPTMVSYMERYPARLTPRMAERLAPVLGVTAAELVGKKQAERDRARAERDKARAERKRAVEERAQEKREGMVKALEAALGVRDEPPPTADELAELEHVRPQMRADCVNNGLRPCPFITCRYNIRLDHRPGAFWRHRLPVLQTDEASCALDFADWAELTFDRIGALFGCNGSMIHQVVPGVLPKLKANFAAASPDLVEDLAVLAPTNASRSERWRREASEECTGFDAAWWHRMTRKSKRAATSRGKVSNLPSGPLLDADAVVACERFRGRKIPLKACLRRQKATWTGRGAEAAIYPECAACSQGAAYAARTTWTPEIDWGKRSKRGSPSWQQYRPDLHLQRQRRRQWIRERPDDEVPTIDTPPGRMEHPAPLDLNDATTRDYLDELASGTWNENAGTCALADP